MHHLFFQGHNALEVWELVKKNRGDKNTQGRGAQHSFDQL